jgi:D-serine deaminase-like pyridoxal phosphate-dependent protein
MQGTPGMTKQEIETPALVMDLDAMDYNLSTMARFLPKEKVRARPHFKNHTILALASRQVQAGAIGITVARVRHAEALVEHGIHSVLVASEVVDGRSIKRLVDLSHRAEIIVAVDHPKIISDMGRLAQRANSTVNVVIDLEVGLGRCGVPLEESVGLARLARESGLKVRGLMGYEGHLQRLPDSDETRRLRNNVVETLVKARRLFEQDGIPVDIVTTGGTGTHKVHSASSGATEVQVGSYLLMETMYAPYAPDFRLGLTVLANIVSKKEGDHLVLDAGMKAISAERGLPSIKDFEGLRLNALHSEHGIVQIMDATPQLNLGDKLELWVAYADATAHLHRQMYGVRGGIVEEVFAIEY